MFWLFILSITLGLIAVIYVLIRKPVQEKMAILIILAAAIFPALAGTVLLQDNLLALRAHYSTLFIFTAAFIISRLAFFRRFNKVR